MSTGDSEAVLIIEDNVDAAELLRKALGMSGHEVLVAHDGIEGLAAARQFHPDVCFATSDYPE